MKQKFLILLCTLMVTINASAYDFAVQNSDAVTIYYNKLTDTTCEVTSGDSKYSGSVNIPELVSSDGDEYSVTSIGEGAFFNCPGLTSVTIPNTITSIGYIAFWSCHGLTSVTIPNSVTEIGNLAFQNCSNLTSVTIPNSVTSIGVCTFAECIGLISVTIPNSVMTIDRQAFYGCSGLTSVSIPNSVTTIGIGSFAGCSSLTSVTIPNSVTTIDNYAFIRCGGLTSVTVDNANPANISLGDEVFSDVPTSTCTLNVPKGSKELYAAADQWRDFDNIAEFEGDASIEEIEIDTPKADIYYDLMGRKVVNPTCGIYIQNGKKVLVK